MIPANRLSPQSLTFLQFVPQPNTTNGAFNFLTTPFSAVSYQRNYTTRIDHTLSSKDSLSGRYLFNDTYEAGIPIWGHDERNNLGRTQGVEASEIHIFNPALINEFRGGWHHFGEAEVFGSTNDPAYDVAGSAFTICNGRSDRARARTGWGNLRTPYPGSAEPTSSNSARI